MKPRTWTPDRVVVEYRDGREERMIHQSPKRACTSCGTVLGDLTESELVIASKNRRLRPSDNECPLCLGFHVLFAEPAPLEPGSETPALTVKLLCPGAPAGVPVAGCAEWARCDCQPPAGVEYPSTEWAEFLAKRCIGSPTGEHRHLSNRDQPDFPFVGAPQPGTCSYATINAGMTPDAEWDAIQGKPGLYPVEVEVYPVEVDANGPDTLVFEPVEIRLNEHAEAIPV